MSTATQATKEAIGSVSIQEIIKRLSEPIAERHLKHKVLKGRKISFITWYHAVKYLDLYAPGWSGEVRSVTEVGGRVVVVYRITIPCLEGAIYREATGQESDWDEEEETRYGDPSSNAEAMAFKRAAAKFGLGLHLYGADAGSTRQSTSATRSSAPAPQEKQPTAEDLAREAQAPLPSQQPASERGWKISEQTRSKIVDLRAKLEELGITEHELDNRIRLVGGTQRMDDISEAGAAKVIRSLSEWINTLLSKGRNAA